MTATIGIATTGDKPQMLLRAVDSVLRSASRLSADAELLVVVNGRERLPELERVGSPMLRVVFLDERNVAAARNTVLARARYDTVLFTDDHCVVPPDWCGRLVSALREPGCAVVAAPVGIEVGGPLSAFLNYQRLYDATPAGPDDTLLVATGNSGMRRDRIPPAWFDTRLHDAGEDSEFGLMVREAGLRIRWLGDTTPVMHALSERVEEITRRLMRYGRGGAWIQIYCGRSQAARPAGLELYRDMTQETYLLYRHFGEITDPDIRTAFVVYDYMAVTSSFMGYLDAVGRAVGETVIELDTERLLDAWREIAAHVSEPLTGRSDVDWQHLPVDYTRLGDTMDEVVAVLTDVRAAMRRYARPIPGRPTGPAVAALAPMSDGLLTDAMSDIDRLGESWTELLAGPQPVTPEALNLAARAAATSFWVAGNLIEIKTFMDARKLARERRVAEADHREADRRDAGSLADAR